MRCFRIVVVSFVLFTTILLPSHSQAAAKEPFFKVGSFINSINICGTVLYVAASDGKIRGISLKDGLPISEFTFEKIETPLGISPSSAYFVICEFNRGWVGASSSNGRFALLDKKLKILSTYDLPEMHSYAAVFTPGESILLSTAYGTVRALELPGFKPIWDAKANWDAIKTISISPDGKLFATGSNDSRIHIRRTKDGKKVKTLRGHKDGIYTLSWSSDGKHVLSGSKDRRLLYWNIETGDFIELHKDFTYIYAAIIVEDKLAVASTNENEISIFSVPFPSKLATLKGHTSIIASFAYHDGFVYSGSTNGEIRKWDIRKYVSDN